MTTLPELYKEKWSESFYDTDLFISLYVSSGPSNILHPTKDQEEIIKQAETGKFDELWMAGGNSAGKTWTAAFMAVKWACYKTKPNKIWENIEEFNSAPYSVLCTGPEQKSAVELWEKIEKFFKDSPFLKHKVASITTGTKRNPHPTITLKNGAVIVATGLHEKGKHVEGDAHDLILINEPPDVRHLIHCVEKVLTPRTWRRGGVIAGFGTPKGKGEYYALWLPGIRIFEDGGENPNYNPRVFSCYVDSRTNQYANQEKIGRFLSSKDDSIIEERIMGRFTDNSALAFPDSLLEEIIDDNLPEHIDRRSGRRYLHGVDFGRKDDYTVCITVDVTDQPYTVVNFYREGGGFVTWDKIISDLLDIYRQYGGDMIIDSTASAGDMQQEWLSDVGIPFIPYNFGGSPGKKISLINNLQYFISQKMLKIPYIYQLRNELHSYPRDLNDKGMETDCVMSLALAVHGIKEYQISSYPEPYKK